MPAMTIAKAARAAGVNVDTIRFYERKGIIEQPPRPAGGGYRVYPWTTIRRVRFIREAQKLGFSLLEAAELASLEADPGADAQDVCAHATAKIEEIDEKIRRLQEMRTALHRMVEACPGQGALAHCSIIAALAGPAATDASRAEDADTVNQ